MSLAKTASDFSVFTWHQSFDAVSGHFTPQTFHPWTFKAEDTSTHGHFTPFLKESDHMLIRKSN